MSDAAQKVAGGAGRYLNGEAQDADLLLQNLNIWTAATRKKSTSGRGGGGKIELAGINKLRELIFELAVRGKLVSQDSEDEPASVFLARLADEKAHQIETGKLKAQKPVPVVDEKEMPFNLPLGWEWGRLSQCAADIHYGFTASADTSANECRLLRITDIQNDKVDWGSVPGCIISKEQAQSYLLRDGDILIARTGGTIGKSYLVEGLSVKSVFASYLIRVRKLGSAYPKYLKLYMGSQLYWGQLYGFSSGTGQPNVNGNALKKLLVPIPPIQEQYRIVAKVDELMALCDQLEQKTEQQLDAHQQLVESLLSTLTSAQNAEELATNWQRLAEHFDLLFAGPMGEWAVDRLKDTILQLAVMGKLVPQDPNDEPASVLLERIQEEKARLIAEGKLKKQKPLPPISEEEKACELPDKWDWVRLGDIIGNTDAGWSPACPSEPSPNDETWGVLKTTAVQKLSYLEAENKALPASKEPRPQYEVSTGDILITRAGPKNRVGVCCAVDSTRPRLMISDKIIRFHAVTEDVTAGYLALCLNVGHSAEFLERSKSGMAESQMNISQDKLKMTPVPFCSLDMQLRIGEKIEELMDVCDQLKAGLRSFRSGQLKVCDALVKSALSV